MFVQTRSDCNCKHLIGVYDKCMSADLPNPSALKKFHFTRLSSISSVRLSGKRNFVSTGDHLSLFAILIQCVDLHKVAGLFLGPTKRPPPFCVKWFSSSCLLGVKGPSTLRKYSPCHTGIFSTAKQCVPFNLQLISEIFESSHTQ